MKVLVLGGTGAIGMHLVHLLSNNGVETIVTSRKQKSAEENINYVQGNAHDIKFLQTILLEPLDAIVDFMSYSTQSFKERISFLLDATSQYVFLSSSRVYADSEVQNSPRLLDVSQDIEFLSTDEYSLAKARQENILSTSKRKNWTIIRPYITYSENRLQLGTLEKEAWLYRALQGRTIVFSSDINSKFTTLTYGLDVSKGIMAVIGNSKALGDTFHITINHSITWSDILGIYLSVLEKSLGQKPKVLLQDLHTFFKCTSGKYQIYYDRLFNREFNNSKISQYLNVDNFTKADVGLLKCLEGFLVNPRFNRINWKLEALRDRQARERTPLMEIQGIKQKVKYLFFRYLIVPGN
jgi:nucleoside-diphosphate-sugar epimerase